MYLYTKDLYEAKYQYLVKKREKVGLNNYNDPKAFIEYSNNMQDVYKYNPGKKRKVLLVFDVWLVIWSMIKKLNPVVTELFTRGRKLNISIVFITKPYLKYQKDLH